MKQYFTQMFAFERWANEALLTWLEAHPQNTEATRNFAHLIADSQPWLSLMRGSPVPPGFNPEPDWTLEECRKQFEYTMNGLDLFLADQQETDFDRIVRSPRPSGTAFENTLTEVLTHLLNHSEHHRGQIMGAIAKETGDYVPSVYMSYLRRPVTA